MLFMGVSSLALAVAFHAMRGMYLHAERLLAKAGRQGAMRRGIAHPKGKRSAVIFRRKIMGRPLAPRQGRALSEAWFPYSRASARHISGAALRAGHRPAEVGGGSRIRLVPGGDFLPIYPRLMPSSP